MNKKSSMKKDKSNYNGAVVLGLNDALVEIAKERVNVQSNKPGKTDRNCPKESTPKLILK